MIVGQQLNLSWDDYATVGVSQVATWQIFYTVEQQVSISWLDLMTVSNTYQISWNTYNVCGGQFTCAWVVCAFAHPHAKGTTTGITALEDTGTFTYRDVYGQLYTNIWSWAYNRTVLDLTVVTEQPYIWGELPSGVFRGKDLYRRGIITVHRTVIQPNPDGYTILAEGYSQYIDFVRASFHCSPLPVDPFLNHLDQGLTDELHCRVTSGPRFADPTVLGDSGAVWGSIDTNNIVATSPDVLFWIDIWSNTVIPGQP